jgi:hypothetical protein
VLKTQGKSGGSQWESEDGPARSVTISATYNLAETAKAADFSQLGTRGWYAALPHGAHVGHAGGSPWLRLVKPEAFEPSEEGGNSGYGISIGLFEVEDLLAEAKHLEKQGCVGAGEDDYATVHDWLEDFGLDLVKGAMRRFQKRIAQQKKRPTGGAA